MLHIFWSWKVKRSFLESKGRPEERTSKIMLHDLFSALLEGKSPHQTEPSQHLSKNSLPWGYRSKIYFTSLLLQLSSFILPFFPFLLFYQLSLLLTDVTAFPLYFISSSPSVTSQAQLLLVFSWVSQSCWTTWDGANVPLLHLPLIFTPFHSLPHFHMSEMVHQYLLNTATISGMAEVSFWREYTCYNLF